MTSPYKPFRNHQEWLYICTSVCICCCMHLSYCLCSVWLFSTFVRIVSIVQFVDEKKVSKWTRRLLGREKKFWWWLNRYRGEISVSNVLSTVSRKYRILKELHSQLRRFVRKKLKVCYCISEGNFWGEKHMIKLWALGHPMWIHNLSFYKVINHHDINRSQKT